MSCRAGGRAGGREGGREGGRAGGREGRLLQSQRSQVGVKGREGAGGGVCGEEPFMCGRE